jgi:hypothetical protein
MFRHYDRSAHTVSVMGDRLDLQALITETEAIVARVIEQHGPTWWESKIAT